MTIFLMLLLSSTVSAFAQMETSLDTITVSPDVDKQSTPQVRATGSTQRLDAAELRKTLSSTIRDAAQGLSGVEFTGGPRAQAQLPQIRGLDASRILILEDGVRQNFISTHNGRAFGDYSLMENLEIVKGPWSSLYGSGAMGGVISVRRSTADDLIRRTGKSRGVQIETDGASVNDSFGQRVTGFGKIQMWEPLLSYRHSRNGDVRLGDGTRLPYSDGETQDFYAALALRPSERQNFTLKLNRFEDRARLPLEPEQELSARNVVGDYKTSKEDVIGDYNLRGASWDFHAKPFWRRTTLQKIQLSSGRNDRQIVATTGIDAWNNWRWTPTENVKTVVTTGVDYFQDKNDGQRNGGPLGSFPDGTNSQLGVYLQPTTTVGRLTLTPGVRVDSFRLHDSSSGGRDNSAQNTSLKAYADYMYSEEKHVFAGWGQAFNAPRLQDLYSTGYHFPGNFFVANPDLKPERADTFEFGAKNNFRIGNDALLAVNATYFRTEAHDFIYRNVQATTTRFENRDRVRLEGFEAAVLYSQGLWGAGLSYTQVRSHDKVANQPLADTPADQWVASVQYFASDTLSVGTQMRLAMAQTRVPAGSSTSPCYYVQDIFATYSPGAWQMRLRLDNAFDRDYKPHTSAIKSAGRDVRVSLGYTF
ncbi:MAG: TonB-dependent receptor [Bdellovibrionales bacterium]|nr:TonB-dependent receptor [Bdellovibrionales bacterium]